MLNLFELTLQFKGFPIKEAKKRLQQIQEVNAADYEVYHTQLRQHVLEYHLKENSFYRNFIGERPVTNWNQIPVLTKKDLQVPLIDRFSHGFSARNTYTGRTSGSSGKPLVYAKDHFCHAMTWAHIMDRFGWHGVDFNSSYQARFYGIPLDFKKYQKERLKDRLARRFRFPIFDLSEKKLAIYLDTFRRKKFDHINGHTSSIVLFAKFLKSQNIVLTTICPSLRVCIVTSEMLYADDRKLLEQWIGVPIVNEYGASELGLIAFEDDLGRLRLNNETLYIEILDDADKPVSPGIPGRIIVTALFNKAHPFIRYDVGDLGVLDPESNHTVSYLQKIVGRSNDNAVLPNGTAIPGHTFYYVVKTALLENSAVNEFIVEQTAATTFNFKYVADTAISESEQRALEKSIFTYVQAEVTVTYEKVTALDRSNGKLKQFVNLFKANN